MEYDFWPARNLLSPLFLLFLIIVEFLVPNKVTKLMITELFVIQSG